MLVLVGVIVDNSRLGDLTWEFLHLKKTFFPQLAPAKFLSGVLVEIKGADIRRRAAKSNRRAWRPAIGFLDKLLGLLEKHQARLVGRVWVKGIGTPIDGRAIYTYSIQSICTSLQRLLEAENDCGIVIADSRRKSMNTTVAHSVFTAKFRAKGDAFDRVLEMPTFGHSENHVGLQLADLVASGLVFPMAVSSYCAGYVTNTHVRPAYSRLKARFAQRVKALQFRYSDGDRERGGLVVSDGIAQRPGHLLFR